MKNAQILKVHSACQRSLVHFISNLLVFPAPIQQNGRKSRKLYAVPNKETKPVYPVSELILYQDMVASDKVIN